MDITNVGTRNMGRAIAAPAVAGGHRGTMIGTTLDKVQFVADELSGDVQVGTLGGSTGPLRRCQ